MTGDLADQELNQAEIFLRAVLLFTDEPTSNDMWERCKRHEWADYVWDAGAPTDEGPGALVAR